MEISKRNNMHEQIWEIMYYPDKYQNMLHAGVEGGHG